MRQGRIYGILIRIRRAIAVASGLEGAVRFLIRFSSFQRSRRGIVRCELSKEIKQCKHSQTKVGKTVSTEEREREKLRLKIVFVSAI